MRGERNLDCPLSIHFSLLGHEHALTYYAVCRKLKMDFLSLHTHESNGVTLFNTLDASLMGPKMQLYFAVLNLINPRQPETLSLVNSTLFLWRHFFEATVVKGVDTACDLYLALFSYSWINKCLFVFTHLVLTYLHDVMGLLQLNATTDYCNFLNATSDFFYIKLHG